MSPRHPAWLRTWAARLALGGLAALALLGRGRRPGERLEHPPALVESPFRTAPLVVTAVPRPSDASLPADTTADSGQGRRLPALLPLHQRARAGERVRVEITAYCLQGITRAGNRVRPGIVAADRKLFPLGKYIDVRVGRRRMGRFLVDDTGADIQGARLDLWTESCADARRFGRRRGSAALVLGAVPRDSLEPPVTRLMP